MEFHCYCQMDLYEKLNIPLINLTVGKRYKISFKYRFDEGSVYSDNHFGFIVRTTKDASTSAPDYSSYDFQCLADKTTVGTEYSVTYEFDATASTMYWIWDMAKIYDGRRTILQFYDTTIKEVRYDLPGEFSVSDTKKVRFSKGNLQATYHASTDSYTWGFAEHQYDYIDDRTTLSGVFDKIDGFVVTQFAWSREEPLYYGIYVNNLWTNGTGNFRDWGTAIDNAGTWFTLSKDEWDYLLGSNAARNDNFRYGITVAGKTNCMVLYPDNWSGERVNNGDTTSFDTASKWSSAESSGLVCLPAAGGLYGSGFLHMGYTGFYWSSTAVEDSTTNCYVLVFNYRIDDEIPDLSPEIVSTTEFETGAHAAVRLVTLAE